MASNRFVLLHHTGAPDGDHYDLMLERDGALATWRLASADVTGPAVRIDDHRLAYLDYEGPVSDGRGEVRRIEAGTYEVDSWSAERVRVRLASGRTIEIPGPGSV